MTSIRLRPLYPRKYPVPSAQDIIFRVRGIGSKKWKRVKKNSKIDLNVFQFDESVTNAKLTDCSVDIPAIKSLN